MDVRGTAAKGAMRRIPAIVLMYMVEKLRNLRNGPEGLALLVLFIVAAVFFASTNPGRVSPVVCMIGFGLLLGMVYCVVRLLARVCRLKDRLTPMQYTGYVFGATVLPVLLLALQSLGQLTWRDAATLLLIFGVGYFYMSRVGARR